jgi:hypothetical protein
MSRRFQFSLKFLFLVTTALSIWLGSLVNLAERQQRVISAVERLGGDIGYDYQYNSAGDEIAGASLPGPSWLHRLIGDDYFRSIISIAIYEATDEKLAMLDDCDSLRALLILGSVTDSSIPRLSRLKKLKSLALINTQVTADGLEDLSVLQELELLELDTILPDDGARRLQEALPRREIHLGWRFLSQPDRILPPLRPR